VRIELRWTVGADLSALTRFFCRYSAAVPTANDLELAIIGIRNAGTAHIKPLQHENVRQTEINITDLNTSTGHQAELAGWGQGAELLHELPASTCVLMNYKVARRYRGGKPRGYWPLGVGDNMSNMQTWSTTFVSEAQAGLTAFLIAVEEAGTGAWHPGTQVNVSYFEKGTWVNDPVTGRPRYIPKRKEPPHVDEISGRFVSNRIASQRRRLLAGA
jgi:hypothetical protein